MVDCDSPGYTFCISSIKLSLKLPVHSSLITLSFLKLQMKIIKTEEINQMIIHPTFHFGLNSVSEETSSMKDVSSLNIISHASRCEWPRAIVAAC